MSKKKVSPEIIMSDEERDRVKDVLSKQRQMLDAREDQISRWEDNIKRQQFEKDVGDIAAAETDGKSSLRIPLEFAFVESKIADEIDTLPYVRVLPTEVNDMEDAKLFQKIMEFVLDNRLNINNKFMSMLLHKNTLGDSILKVYWYTEWKEIQRPKVKIDKDGNRTVTFKKEKIKIYDDVKVDVVDIRNFLIDPICYQAGKTIDDAQFCEFIYLYDIDTFKKQFGDNPIYKNVDLVGLTGDRLRSEGGISSKESVANIRNQYVEVCEHWDVLNDKFITLANDIEIRYTPIPYYNPHTGEKKLPFSHFIGHKAITGFWNFGEIDLVKDLVEERQTQRNINVDASKAYTHPFIAVGGNNDFDIDGFVWGINSFIEIEDVNQMRQFSMAGNSGLPFSLEGANQDDAIVATGNDVRGVLPTSGQTATETIEKREAGIKRTRLTNKLNELNGYQRFYELVKNLILQFYGPDEIKRIRGESLEGGIEFYELNKDILGKDYDISIVTNNQIPASRELQKLRNKEILGVLGSLPINPETGQLPKHLIPGVKRVLEDLDVKKEEIAEAIGEETKEEGKDELTNILERAKSVLGERQEEGQSMESVMGRAEEVMGGFEKGRTPSASATGSINERAESMNVTQ